MVDITGIFLGAFGVIGGNKLFLGICAALLALTSGLAAACFVKAFGITFLAQPRSHYAQNAKEVALSMRLGMFILAFLAVIFGLAAAPIIKLLAKVSGSALGIDVNSMSFSLNNLTIAPQAAKNIYLSVPSLALCLAILGIAGFVIYRIFGRGKAVVYKTWDCGYYKLGPRNEYTATAFSKPFRIAFSFSSALPQDPEDTRIILSRQILYLRNPHYQGF